MATSIKQRLDDFSPIICRLMARKANGKNVRLMTDGEISKRCKVINWFDVRSMQMKPNWDNVPVMHALDFMCACGIDLDNSKEMDKHTKYLKRKPSWSHVKKHHDYKTRWLPLMLIQADYERAKHGE